MLEILKWGINERRNEDGMNSSRYQKACDLKLAINNWEEFSKKHEARKCFMRFIWKKGTLCASNFNYLFKLGTFCLSYSASDEAHKPLCVFNLKRKVNEKCQYFDAKP